MLDETRNDINGLNLYMYCSNNPIMFSDPSGQGFWSWLGNKVTNGVNAVGNAVSNGVNAVGNFLGSTVGQAIVTIGFVAVLAAATLLTGGALLPFLVFAVGGALVGGAFGGYSAYKNRTDIASGIFSGAITGAALGAVTMLPGLGALGVGIMLGTTFSAGALSYSMETFGNKREFSTKDMFINAGVTVVQGIFTYGVGSVLRLAETGGFGFEMFKYYMSKATGSQLGYVVDIAIRSTMHGRPLKREEGLRYLRTWLL